MTEDAVNKKGPEDEFIPCPMLGEKELTGRVRKEMLQSCGSAVYSDVEKFKVPLKFILSTAKSLIEENGLSPGASYNLLRPCLDGASQSFLSTQESLNIPFKSFWGALQHLNTRKTDPSKLQENIHELKTSPCYDVSNALVKLFKYHSELHRQIPFQEREQIVLQAARADAWFIIRMNLPSAFHRIMEKESVLKKAYYAELSELYRRGETPTTSNMRCDYHPYNSLLTLVAKESTNVSEHRGSFHKKGGHVNEVAEIGHGNREQGGSHGNEFQGRQYGNRQGSDQQGFMRRRENQDNAKTGNWQTRTQVRGPGYGRQNYGGFNGNRDNGQNGQRPICRNCSTPGHKTLGVQTLP